jgi:hypothetical protein
MNKTQYGIFSVKEPRSCTFHPREDLLFSACQDGTLNCYKITDPDTRSEANGSEEAPSSSTKRKKVCFVQVVDRFGRSCDHKGPCRALVTDTSGSLVVMGFARNQLVCMDCETGKEVCVIEDPDLYTAYKLDERALHCLAPMHKSTVISGKAPTLFMCPVWLVNTTHQQLVGHL